MADEDQELQDAEEYPPDPDEELDDSPPTKPQVRSKALRKAVLQRGQVSGKSPKTVARGGKRILTKQKQRQALELRKAGASYAQIAEQLGYKDASGASKAVKRAFGDVIQEPVTDLKAMQIERLNHMLLVIWPKVQQGDDRSINTARGLMNDLNDLMGTRESQEGTTQVTNHNAVLVIDGNETEYIQAMKRMVGIDTDGSNIVDGPDMTAIDLAPTIQPGALVVPSDVIDAEEVEDDEKEELVIPEKTPTEKKFKFGVDPTVKRKGDDA